MQFHMNPPPRTLIKSKNNARLEKYRVKNILIFDNGELEEFLLLVRKPQMTLEGSGALADSANFQYFRTILHK